MSSKHGTICPLWRGINFCTIEPSRGSTETNQRIFAYPYNNGPANRYNFKQPHPKELPITYIDTEPTDQGLFAIANELPTTTTDSDLHEYYGERDELVYNGGDFTRLRAPNICGSVSANCR